MTAAARSSDAVASDAAATNRGIALLRVALVPIALVVAVPEPREDAFPATLAVFAAYALAMLVLAFLPRARSPRPTLQALVDLALIGALVFVSGGAASPLRFAFYVMPIGAALRLSPRLTATWLGLALAAYLTVAVPHPQTDLPDDLDFVAEQGLALLWVGAAAVMLSALVGRRERRLVTLAAARRQLVQQALDAEARERRRLAETLHDGAIQNVLVARQEVADAARGVPGAADRARHALDETHAQLRREVHAMHPLGLERAGLAAVLRGIAESAGRRARLQTSVIVDAAAAGVRDDLVAAIVRELATNTVRHARASRLEIRVTAEPDHLQVTVGDDGDGLPPGRPEQALAEGHIGLAATTERVRAVGGDIEIDSTTGHGTTITILVPKPET